MNTAAALRYHLFIYRREHFWLPLGLWSLFALMVVLMRGEGKAGDVGVSFLGFVLPLVVGILAAPAIVDDPALELQLAAPRRSWLILVERLVVLLAIAAAAALAYQVLLLAVGIDVSYLGDVAKRQLVWLLPSLTLAVLASAAALASAHATGGAMFAGAVWISHLIFRDWFLASPWARYPFLFMGALQPDSPDLVANCVCLLAIAAMLLVMASALLKKGERYL